MSRARELRWLPVGLRIGWLLVLLPLATATDAATIYRAFGDSVTEGVGDSPGGGGYPARLQTILRNGGVPDAEVVNHGLGGEPSSSGLTRINGVIALGGDTMLIMTGTNDVRIGLSLESTLFNISEMGRKSAAGGFEPVYATIIPRLPSAAKDPENIRTWKIVVGQRDLAWSESRDLVDNYEIFDNTPNKFTALYSKDPADQTGHPNALGYDVMADTFGDVLRDLDRVGPVPGSFQPVDDASAPSRLNFQVVLYDHLRGINLDESVLLINGAAVNPEITGDSSKATLTYLSDGEYAGITTLGVRSQDLRQANPNTIERTLASFTVAGGDVTPPPGGGGIEGDIDRSGRVDGDDLVLLGLHFGSSAGDPDFCADCDLDRNGILDGDDLAILAANFGNSAG